MSDAVGGRLGWPDTLYHALLVLLGIGFFIALVIAWYHGEKGRQRVSGPELLMVAALLVVAGGVLTMLPRSGEVTWPEGDLPPARFDDGRPSIAVLPFDNFSPNPDDAYFADGMLEEITSKLSSLSALHVISRSSVMQYKERRPSSPQIAAELGVDFLVEGSARLAGGEVRLTVQLIDAVRDGHLWSEDYDLDLSAQNLFEVQGEVAREIAFEIGVSLTPEEREAVGRVLTDNTEAYLLFLQGNEEFLQERVRGSVGRFPSTDLLRRAAELDPNFALAHAQYARSLSHTGLWYAPDKWELVKRAADTALALLPGLEEGQLALARYFLGTGQREDAIRQYQVVLDENPNSAQAASGLFDLRRRAGEFEAALRALQQAALLSPRDPILLRELAWSYIHLHRYDEALQTTARLWALQQTNHPLHLRAFIHLARGELEEALSAIADLIAHFPEKPHYMVHTAPFSVVRRMLSPDQLRTAFEAYLAWDASLEGPCHTAPVVCYRKAVQAEEVGSPDRARTYWDSLEMVIDEVPGLFRRARVYQGLGQKDRAIQAAEAFGGLGGAGEVTDQFYGGPNLSVFLARILAHFGEHDRAIDILEEELPAPSWLSVPLLEIDPIWDPLRDHPRFQALLERYAGDVEH